MSHDDDSDRAHRLAQAAWNSTCEIATFNREHVARELGARADQGLFPKAQWMALRRSVALHDSLSRLCSPWDFQAVAAACRAMLELVVDCVLLQHERDGEARYLDWEKSAKWKHADGMRRYLADVPAAAATRDFTFANSFVEKEAMSVERARRRWGWVDKKGKPLHPSRWTKRKLGEDSRECHRYIDRQEVDLERIYKLDYPRLCWLVHGSGGVMIDDVGFADGALAFQALRTCGDLAMLHARLALVYSGAWDDAPASWEAKFADQRHRAKAAAALSFAAE